jgi:adenosyl cobinamide kinase/adenosyl cobinamide phosphate guanylyltransferase
MAEYVIRIVIDPSGATDGGGKVVNTLNEIDNSATEANQSLELLKKGFSALRTVLEAPIDQFLEIKSLVEDLSSEYDNAFLAEERLNSALLLSGQYSKELSDHLIDLASNLASTSRFEDDAIIEGEKLAVLYGKQGDALDRLIAVSVKYAQFMGVSFDSAVVKVARSLETGSIILGRYPVILSAAGDAATKTEEVLSKLEKIKIGKDLQDDILASQKAFSELREELGRVLNESSFIKAFFIVVGDSINKLTVFVSENKREFQDLFGRVFKASLDVAASSFKIFFDIAQKGFEILLNLIAKLSTSYIGSKLGFEQITGPEVEAFSKATEAVRESQEALRVWKNIPLDESGAVKATIDKITEGLEANKIKANEARDAMLGLGGTRTSILGLVTEVKDLANRLSEVPEIPKSVDDLLERITKKTAELEALNKNTRTEGTPFDPRSLAAKNETVGIGGPTDITDQNALKVYKQIFEAQDKFKTEQQAINVLLGSMTITDEQKDTIKRAYLEMEIAGLQSSTKAADGFTIAFDKIALEAENSSKVVQDVMGVAVGGFTNLLTNLISANRQSWKTIANDAIQEIERIILSQLVLKAISGAGAAVSAGSYAGGSPAPEFAEGGPAQAMRPIKVGERGTELFVPQTNGKIVPNEALGGSEVHITIVNVDDERKIGDFLQSGQADKVILNRLYENRTSLSRIQG